MTRRPTDPTQELIFLSVQDGMSEDAMRWMPGSGILDAIENLYRVMGDQ